MQKSSHQTRTLIMGCALELFAARGFHGTSVEAIARKAGVSKGLLYHYFAGKDEILKALIQQGLTAIGSVLNTVSEIEDPYQQIAILIERTFTILDKEEHFWRLYTGLLLQPDVWEDFKREGRQFFQQTLEQLEGMLRRIGIANPVVEARVFAALLDGISLHYMMDKETYPLEAVKNALIRKYSRKDGENK